jgi:hypothetical protein
MVEPTTTPPMKGIRVRPEAAAERPSTVSK